VQGVWFRASARECATALGVDGSARNLADGRVELIAEGAADAIDSLIAWCGQGPSGARVDAVSVEEQELAGEPAGFRIGRE
jgi:acylphosphatase